MGFALPSIDPIQGNTVSQWDIPFNDWIAHRFGEGQMNQAGSTISRGVEESIAGGPTITPELANKVFGIPGHLAFDTPLPLELASLKNQRKLAEINALQMAESADHSALSFKGVSGFAANMVGSIAHPLDFALMFAPFVGGEKAVASLGRPAVESAVYRARSALARGLITEEQLAAYTKFPQFGASVVNATAGMSALEIPKMVEDYRSQGFIEPGQAIVDIATGAAAGATLHVFGAVLKRAMKGAHEAWGSISNDTREQIVKEELNAFVEGRQPDHTGIVGVDDAAIREHIKQGDMEAAKEAIMQANPNMPEAKAAAKARLEQEFSLGGATKDDVVRIAEESLRGAIPKDSAQHAIVARLLERISKGELDFQTIDNLAGQVGMHYDPGAVPLPKNYWDEPIRSTKKAGKDAYYVEVAQAAEKRPGITDKNAERQAQGLDIIKQAQRAIDEFDATKTGHAPGNVIDDAHIYQKQDRLRQLIEQTKQEYGLSGVSSNPQETTTAQMAKEAFMAKNMDRRVGEERAKRIQDYVAKKRQELTAVPEASKVKSMTYVTPKAEIDKYKVTTDPTESDAAQARKDIAGLKSDIQTMTAENPDLLKAVQTEIEAQLPKDLSAAVDAALPCVLEGSI